MRAPPALLSLSLPLSLSLSLWLPLSLPGGAGAYGFRNCIQSPRDPGSFRCVQRFLRAAAAAVSDLPAAATALNLSRNALPALGPRAFAGLPALRSLDVAHNALAALAPGAFAGLAALRSLDLAHNRLRRLEEGALAGLGNLTRLRLDHNPLGALAPGALRPLRALRRLSLRGGRLAALAPVAAAVAPLRALRLLDLCGNRIAALGPAPPLPEPLAALRLCNNSLRELRGAAPALLPRSLRDLDLSYNNISAAAPFARLRLRGLRRLRVAGNALDALELLRASDVRPRGLDPSGLRLEPAGVRALCGRLAAGGARLPRLRLRGNGLRELPDGALSACPALGALDLSGNRLRELRCAGRLLAPRQRAALGELRAEHNALRRLAPCGGAPELPALRNLSLRFNRILLAGPGAFAFAPGLRELRLDVNGLARLDRAALRGLRELRALRLDNNLLSDLFAGSFADLGQLRSLNLRNNRVSVLFAGAFAGLRRLDTLDLGGNNLRHLAGAALRGLGALRRLYLDRNRLQELSAEAFRAVRGALEVLDLRANALRFEHRAPRRPPPFRELGRLRALKLQAQQPFGLHVVPRRLFQGLRSLSALHLSQNWLLAVAPDAFDDLARLGYLGLADSGGGMGDLPAGVFKNLSALRVLDLENAGLRSLGAAVLGNLSALRQLRLARNALRTLDPALPAALPALRYLDLRKCPLRCACANAWLPRWLRRAPLQAVYLFNYTCGGADGGGGGAGGAPRYLHRFDAAVCFAGAGRALFAGTAPALLLLLALPLLRARAGGWLRYRLWALRAGRRRDPRRFAFHAFVSYSAADEAWVLGELVPRLEGAALRLCLHHRDFAPGRAVLDNIADAVHASRAAVCVLSRAFLRSAWCHAELQLATHRLLEERLRDALVLVFLERVPARRLPAFLRLRPELLRRTHLRWPADPRERPLFWARLQAALRGAGGDDDEEEEEG
ncbi:uncharacterized protein [Patagioenas fasciata]|uniref:uncharacterized protein n=1 Tax=Patagioenas fasciata TaxID=372321 RepID=UPI003A98DCF9